MDLGVRDGHVLVDGTVREVDIGVADGDVAATGDVVMEDDEVRVLDERAVIADARAAAERLVARAGG